MAVGKWQVRPLSKKLPFIGIDFSFQWDWCSFELYHGLNGSFTPRSSMKDIPFYKTGSFSVTGIESSKEDSVPTRRVWPSQDQ